VQNANAKQYAYFPAVDEVWQLRKIGLGAPTTHANHHLTLPCHCQVCQTLKYTDVLSVLPGALVTHTLVYHNTYQMNNYIKTMYPLVAELTVKELTELMMAQLGNRRGVDEARWGIQFADAIAEHGYGKARKKFSTYLAVKTDVEYEVGSSLFDTMVEEENSSEAAARAVTLAKRYLSSKPEDKGVHGKEIKTTQVKKVNVARSTKRKTAV
jgi:hypothetical protein